MPIFDRFDICEAYYCFAESYHGGQWSKEYRIFGRLDAIEFRPSPMLCVERLSENAREIYDALVEKHLARGLAYIAPAKG
jgi:hypothetical protein